MGGLFRSQDMNFISLTMNDASARSTIGALGRFGKVHVIDMSHPEAPSKEFTDNKRKDADCLYWERKLEALEEKIKDYKIPLRSARTDDEKAITNVEGVKDFVLPIEEEVNRNIYFQSQNQGEINNLKERVAVLDALKETKFEMAGADLKEGKRGDDDGKSIQMLTKEERKRGYADEEEGQRTKFKKLVTGTIPDLKQEGFVRMVYRVTRGNSIAEFIPIAEPLPDYQAGEKVLVRKSVFWVLVVGDQLARRVTKVAQVLGATVFEIPQERGGFDRELKTLKETMEDKRRAEQYTVDEIKRILERLSFDDNKHYSPLRAWQHALFEEHCILRTFMKCHYSQNLISLEGWTPTKDLEELKEAVNGAVRGSGVPPAALEIREAGKDAPTDGPPPTYFETNLFTYSFQNIVNTYGYPRYKEINPGLMTIITFPFLFGVMFGDIGHGLCLTFFISFVLIREKAYLKEKEEKGLGDIFSMIFAGRYVILFMSLFATYAGFVYNECFSLPLHLHKETWTWNNATQSYDPDPWYIYPFGVDYTWFYKDNQLAFFNSLKMKLSVILGVAQMTFGLFLSLGNHVYFRDWLSIFFEFLPRMFFLFCTFGYMIAIIIYKWTVDWRVATVSPPSLIQTMIKMFLSPGKVEPEKMLYEGQATLQLAFLIIALVSIPWMLFPKPIIHNYLNKRASRNYQAMTEHPIEEEVVAGDFQHASEERVGVEDDETAEHKDLKYIEHKAPGGGSVKAPKSGGGGHGHGPYSFSDDFIHTAIHTIEYVLGTVSNTASYLRLWALSLAHSELATVFWDKIFIEYGVESGNIGLIFVCWAIWAGATFAVLLCMDVLECFLHALRLHWVEFQNKFYYADGYAFEPFSFVQDDDD